jgi:hypothetical protein
LRERARKLDQGILIIRYALWFCLEFSYFMQTFRMENVYSILVRVRIEEIPSVKDVI